MVRLDLRLRIGWFWVPFWMLLGALVALGFVVYWIPINPKALTLKPKS